MLGFGIYKRNTCMGYLRRIARNYVNEEMQPGKVARSGKSARGLPVLFVAFVTIKKPDAPIALVLGMALATYIVGFLISLIGRAVALPILKRVAYPLGPAGNEA